jgi:glycosyltransferase involved in cell wall biosynthesis
MTDSTNTKRPFVLHTRVVTGTGGGPEKTLLNSPRFLKQYGIDSACFFMRPPGDPGFAALEERAALAQAEIIGVDDCGPFDRNVVREAIRICRKRDVDIWHGHDYKSNALGLLVSMFHPMHLVTTAHGWVRFTWRTPLYYAIDRLSMRRYAQIICVSQDLVDSCRKARMAEHKLSLIDNAIVETDYNTAPPELSERARFGFGTGQILLGAVGRLSEEKGFHHLINAVSSLVSKGHPIGLLIAGEGHLKETLQQQINQLDMQNHIRLVGYLQDPRELYRAIDVFVLSSLREGLPNVVLEAMATQRPVVTTEVNGIPRLVQNGKNGIVVATDSMQALKEGIGQMLASEQTRQQLAIAGRKTIEHRFSFTRRMQEVVGVYRSLSPAMASRIHAETVSLKKQADSVS